MLEKIDLSKKISKKEYKERMEELAPQIAFLQRALKDKGVPVMIVFEGYGAAGKGTQINRLIQTLDPRGFTVHSIDAETKEERLHPFLWRFWNKTPEKGRIAIFDRSWYRRLLVDRYEDRPSKKELARVLEDIHIFEEQLSADGTLILKFFLDISKHEQKKRFKKLMAEKATRWRVTGADLDRHEHFKEYAKMADEMLTRTDSSYAPWTIVEAEDEDFATVKILSKVAGAFEERYKEACQSVEKIRDKRPDRAELDGSMLKKADLTKKLSKKEYGKRLSKLQERLEYLHGKLYARRIPVVLAFEGWDAGGKGGAIKRLTRALDPRGYTVNPTSSPNDIERAHHYLWRFWTRMPKDGHIAIFDRTWYGRVMVERIEGFCTTQEWQRAYKEIVQMEEQLADHGAVVLKFWLHIDKEEQAERFEARQKDPHKRWKITDEDWRNREKWDLYEKAVDEMLIRTSTAYAPWIIVEGNDKYYARIKVLETVVSALEKRLKKEK